MGDSAALPAEPVFIVCNARSGSTLLRYLLDAHPDVACPPESKVPQTANAVLNLHNDLAGQAITELRAKKHGVPEPNPQSVAAARDVIAGIAAEHLARRGKTVWCDKTLETVHSLDLIGRMFPKARYICVYRHAMDVVASLLESCKWGYAYFNLQQYVARHYNNVAQGFAEYWTARTKLIMGLDQSSARTYPVHYEQLVRDPEGTLTGILEFLDLPRDDKIVRKMLEEAFQVEHDPGAADWKIPFANAVEQRSVERGRAIPGQLIVPPVREEMNALLAALRYPVVNDNWNLSSDLGENVDRSLLSAAPAARDLGSLVDGLLAPRLASYEGPVVRPLRLVATYGDGERAYWLIDSAAKKILPDDGRVISNGQPAPITATTRAEVLHAVLVGGLAPQTMIRLEMLSVRGADAQENNALARFLSALLVA